MIEVTSSTSGRTGTGLKKCMPSTRPGCLVPAPSFMIGTDEVFEARNFASGSSSSSRLNTSRLSCSFSTTASIAASEPSMSSNVEVTTRCSRAAAWPASSNLPERTARASDRSIAARDRSARSSSASTTVTSTPDRAQTSAIPDPIRPPPITPTRMAPEPSGLRRGSGRRQCRHARAVRGPPGRDVGRLRYAASAGGTGTTQTQLRRWLDPGRTIRPAPRSAAACRATSVASLRSPSCCATGVSFSLRVDVDDVVHAHAQFVRHPGRLHAGPITVPLQPATLNWRIEQSRGRKPSRKVRTSQGEVVGNADPGKPAGQCHRKDTA